LQFESLSLTILGGIGVVVHTPDGPMDCLDLLVRPSQCST